MSIARDGHWQDSYGGITTNALTIGWIARAFGWRSRRWPTLPRSLERSTIGAVGLNDRVRNGNGCGPYALTASNSIFNFLQPTAHELFDVGRAEPHVRFGAVDNINSCAMSCER